jgi:hypothetical protein
MQHTHISTHTHTRATGFINDICTYSISHCWSTYRGVMCTCVCVAFVCVCHSSEELRIRRCNPYTKEFAQQLEALAPENPFQVSRSLPENPHASRPQSYALYTIYSHYALPPTPHPASRIPRLFSPHNPNILTDTTSALSVSVSGRRDPRAQMNLRRIPRMAATTALISGPSPATPPTRSTNSLSRHTRSARPTCSTTIREPYRRAAGFRGAVKS